MSMTEKERIILRHTELASEYARLSMSDQSLPEETWKKINKRLHEINIEIEELRKIESTWDEYQDHQLKQKSKFKMFTQEEIAQLFNVSRALVTMWREVGIIKAIKTGKNYMFSQDEVRRFQSDYIGFDVSNRVKALEAYRVVNNV